ncbi:hypothetical protein GCM10027446_22130 [Angustibacter peucedani]
MTALRPGRVLALASASGVLALVVAGCGDGGGTGATPAETVTVTTTPGTASGTRTSTPRATSDVEGRAFDLGTVAKAGTVAGVLVVELDRWTLPGTSDSALATKGVELAPHRGARFTNQNTEKTYSAPVADGARVVLNTCVPGDAGQLGLRSEPVLAATWLEKPDPAVVFVVSYDKTGSITKMESDPRCP